MRRLVGVMTASSIAAGMGLAVLTAHASTSQHWVLRNRGDFQEAKLEGVALAADGRLSLSARVTSLFDAAQPYLWALARDREGRVYAGGGNDGKVFRAASGGGAPEVVFDALELEVHALAFDSKGRLYAGTSPRGSVYRISPDGKGEVVFDPEETYIWAIAFDQRDRMYVATGQRGRVYRVDSPGKDASGVVVVDGREDHIKSLVTSDGETLYAGSDQNGIIYRIPARGDAEVVYDSPMREIAALQVMEGRIYAAAIAPILRQRAGGGGGGQAGGVTRVTVTADEPGGDQEGASGGDEDSEQAQQRRREQTRQAAAETFYGAVFEVTAEGYARKIWESKEVLPLSMASYGEGQLLVGTGNEGRVLLIGADEQVSDFVVVPSSQVNALLADGHGGFLAAGSNLGQVVTINPAAAQEGTITSRSYDAGCTTSWGRLSWTAELPAGASIAFQVRTGNTDDADDSWSPWSADYTNANGTAIERPRARYLQWRAALKGSSKGASPVLRSVQIGYLQDNLPPEVTSVEVLAPGVTLSGSGERAADQAEGAQPQRRSQNPPRRGFEKGRRSVVWKAEDVNGDDLLYDVYFKADDETLWKPLALDWDDEFYMWDATTMPDGVYRLRLVATDAASNPPGMDLTGERTSTAFDVDNTPPVVGPLETRLKSDSAEVTVEVNDSFSDIADAAYSLDAADWVPVLPQDRIADSRQETFEFTIEDLEEGEHTITVRARDRAGNNAANKVVIRVGAGKK